MGWWIAAVPVVAVVIWCGSRVRGTVFEPLFYPRKPRYFVDSHGQQHENRDGDI